MSGACVAESDHLYSFRSVHDAYLSCRRRKRNTINALRFETGLLDNLFDLSKSLDAGTYKPARSVCFVTKQPKHREIFAADFRDRVVHHLLVPQIENIFDPKFIHDSYACRVGKGTHAAVARLRSFMHAATKGGRVAAWFMQLDIRSFFMSIDREILLGILGHHIRDPRVMALAETIVRQDCTANYVYKGDASLLRQIPLHKSLFHIPEGKGLPIGNLTSQFFGNVYLNELDQFIKHKLKVRYYLRYVDDFILLDPDRERLNTLRDEIASFLQKRLALALKPGIILRRVSEGANFLGYIVRSEYVLVRNRVLGNLRARLKKFEEAMVEYVSGSDNFAIEGISRQKISPSPSLPERGDTSLWQREDRRDFIDNCEHSCEQSDGRYFIRIHLREENVQRLRQTLVSYMGHFKHADAYTLTHGLFEKYFWLKEIFTLDAVGRLIPLYEPDFQPVNLRDQYGWAQSQFPEMCIFFQVGSFCEFYGVQAERYAKFFGLKLLTLTITPKGRGRNMGRQSGFPVRMLKDFKTRMLKAGQSFVVIAEHGYYRSGLRKRGVTEIAYFRRVST
jgi:RNA-directed DNA polymerase